MGDVIDLEEVRRRNIAPATPNPILSALDTLALALAEHRHTWTVRERDLYETAVGYLT